MTLTGSTTTRPRPPCRYRDLDVPEADIHVWQRCNPVATEADVAALVSSIDPEATTVELVNLAPEVDRVVIVQAGAFAEHTITGVRYTTCTDDGWIGDMYDYGHTEPVVTETEVPAGGSFLAVHFWRFISDGSSALLHPHPTPLRYVELHARRVPDGIWDELRAQGLIRADVPTASGDGCPPSKPSEPPR